MGKVSIKENIHRMIDELDDELTLLCIQVIIQDMIDNPDFKNISYKNVLHEFLKKEHTELNEGKDISYEYVRKNVLEMINIAKTNISL